MAQSFVFHRRDGRLSLGLRHEPRALHKPVLVDVARAVREDLRRAHANDELRLGPLAAQRVLEVDRRDAVQAKALASLESR